MAERQATVASSSGLHARPAKLFVQAVQNVDIPIMSAYLLLVACDVLAMSYLEHPDNFVVVYGRGLPYLARVRAYDPHHTLLRDYTAARKQQ